LAALSDLEVRALMELQYNFAFWLPDPYAEASARLGVGEDELLKALSGLRERGVLKLGLAGTITSPLRLSSAARLTPRKPTPPTMTYLDAAKVFSAFSLSRSLLF